MLKEKKAAVIVLTPAAKKLALKLKEEYQVLDIYLPSKLNSESDNYFSFNSLSSLVGRIFKEYDALIFIMALGIVVRIIAPLLESKKSDPAVLTIDDTAQNVISTLSGHLGGANQLTAELAEFLEASPVITTATDCNNKLAVDLLAQRLNCEIKPFERLKKANGALLFGRELHIYSDYKIKLEKDDSLKKYSLNQLSELSRSRAFEVIISNHKFNLRENQLQLIPRNIVIGIGCRKNKTAAEIEAALGSLLADFNLLPESIKKVATIDLKKEENGILKLAAANNWPLEIVAREKIQKVEADLDIKKSDFVKKITGVAAAASPAAILASAPGKLIIDKRKYSGITLSVVEEEMRDE
ncbi:MAG: cobalamin biosynthesis protein CbiG [Halanaerobium sp. MDAL1]|jgi:cobalt-precorrin 5A hydrolase|nr:MAG: cobalamin biosynthesis protein CbiG [Halanaerobium sp. MDAL1]